MIGSVPKRGNSGLLRKELTLALKADHLGRELGWEYPEDGSPVVIATWLFRSLVIRATRWLACGFRSSYAEDDGRGVLMSDWTRRLLFVCMQEVQEGLDRWDRQRVRSTVRHSLSRWV